jgi:hypothetical protein
MALKYPLSSAGFEPRHHRERIVSLKFSCICFLLFIYVLLRNPVYPAKAHKVTISAASVLVLCLYRISISVFYQTVSKLFYSDYMHVYLLFFKRLSPSVLPVLNGVPRNWKQKHYVSKSLGRRSYSHCQSCYKKSNTLCHHWSAVSCRLFERTVLRTIKIEAHIKEN